MECTIVSRVFDKSWEGRQHCIEERGQRGKKSGISLGISSREMGMDPRLERA